ncbi:MAG: hypothetical protein M1820_009469 [Bogoriella megaspora]|nr:MAG: hypothetical protein M1820_009469 [Bogoriella megaspora]
MSSTVEAGSLSSLTTLASNPPQYPRNPTETVRSPLVLYIARVPGSKDVFLSPLKPKEKVVSAQDVESSLYYVHIDQPEDEMLIQETATLSSLAQQGAADIQEKPPPLPRRPLSEDRSSFPHDAPLPRRPLPPKPEAHEAAQSENPPTTYKPYRKPITPYVTPISASDKAENSPNVNIAKIQRKPLGGRPLPALPSDVSNSLERVGSKQFSPWPFDPATDDPPSLPPRRPQRYSEGTRNDFLSVNSSYSSDRLQVPFDGQIGTRKPSDAAVTSPVSSRRASYFSQYSEGETQASITLIRRDPGSGAQWNVAKISDPSVTELSSETPETEPRYKQMGAPMFVEVSTPGYSKFVDQPTSLENSQGHISRPSTNPTFERRMYLEGSRHANHTYTHRKSSSQGSATLPSDIDSNAPSSRTTDRGYAFLSPWGGKCQFSTGGAGRSVTCRHSIPSVNSSVSDAPATVSELRFNLPSTSATSSAQSKVSKRASAMAALGRPKLSIRPHSESSVLPTSTISPSPILANMAANDLKEGRDSFDLDADFGRMDLSLGQERAGGGFSGKQAKLGKLIVWDEGLKMLDLLVAANVALWWRAYERVGRARDGE